MRVLARTRVLAVAAALAAAALLPAAAGAAVVSVSTGDFDNGAGGWTSTASCSLLCNVTNAIDATAGGLAAGSAQVSYDTLIGLGGLATGTSTWTSPAVTWSPAAPATAALSVSRRATISGLLTAGGIASWRVQLQDTTAGTSITLADQDIAVSESVFGTRTMTLDPAFLKQGHVYHVTIRTVLSAAVALLSGIRVSYDDVMLWGTEATSAAQPVTSSGGLPATTTQPVATGVPAGGATAVGTGTLPAKTGAPARLAAVKLLSAKVTRFTPGKAMMLRVRALRAGKPLARLVVRMRAGTLSRSIVTNRKGVASVRVTPQSARAMSVVFWVGTAKVKVKAVPR